jgi:hypothetical protein
MIMAQRTIAHMYDRYEDAERVVRELEQIGIPHDNISLVANAQNRGQPGADSTASTTATDTPASTGAGTGATLGTAVGGGLGLLAGIGSLAIPGVGPVVAAGWLVAALTGAGIGAAGGGLVGSLTGAGVSRDEADVYAEGVRGGGSLVTARVDEAEATRVEEVMSRANPVDWQKRRVEYGSDWKGFDPDSRVRVYPANERDPAGRDPGAVNPAGDGTFSPGIDPGRRP